MEFAALKNSIFFIFFLFIVLVFVIGYKKKKSIIKNLGLDVKLKNAIVKRILMSLGCLFFCIALLKPQYLKGYEKVQKKGLNLYFLIDVSKSMDAQDLYPSRLALAKEIMLKIVHNLKGDRVGIIPFSSTAYIQLPLTSDYEIFNMFLSVIDTNMISSGGTNIKEALDLASRSFNTASKGDKVVILLSDGEEHNESAISKASKMGKIKIYTIGIGTRKGSLIPYYDRIAEKKSFKKDEKGNYVVSRLNEETLKKIAELSSAKYYHASIAGEEINALIEELSFLKRFQLKEEQLRIFKPLFQYFTALGLILFLLGFLYDKKDLFLNFRKKS